MEKIINWFKKLFGIEVKDLEVAKISVVTDSPVVQEAAGDIQAPLGSSPDPDGIVEKEATAVTDNWSSPTRNKAEHQVVTELTAELADRAEEFENDQEAFKEFIEDVPKQLLTRAIDDVAWADVISRYSDETLTRIRGSLSNIQTRMEHNQMMEHLVKMEQTRRNAGRPRPTGNGMSSTGGQRGL